MSFGPRQDFVRFFRYKKITPLSSKWRKAIEKRIEDERLLTMQAVDNGATIKPGEFWNLSGTFLFAIYVLTALGFGAPVPHTIWGRIYALIYAIFAVPTHFYLMVNASTCVIVHLEVYIRRLRVTFSKVDEPTKSSAENKRDISGFSRNLEPLKSEKTCSIRNFTSWCLGIISIGRFIPLTAIIYYTIGVVAFGVLRNKTIIETFMFPLEFTTTGGLERVESHVRILYGFYVAGAMCLLACGLAIIRRHSSSTFAFLTDSHRLFESDTCTDCVNTINKETKATTKTP